MQLHRFQVWDHLYTCIMYYVFTNPSQLSFHHHLSSPNPLLPLRTHFPSGNHKTVSMRVFSLLNPFTYLAQAPNSLPSNSCQSVLCIYESVFSIVKLYLPYGLKCALYFYFFFSFFILILKF